MLGVSGGESLLQLRDISWQIMHYVAADARE